MPKYKCTSNIKHGEGDTVKEYSPGDVIELTFEQAQMIPNSIEPYMHSEEDKPQPKKKKGGE